MAMRYRALALDYDGTLATDGKVELSVLAALRRVRASGRRVLLVTGRELPDLRATFDHLDVFDRVVAENGALVFCPETGEERALAEPPPHTFVTLLRQRGVHQLSVGQVIVATWEPYEAAVVRAIRDAGLELEVIFNKGAVMVLPSGVNKATGLRAALDELGLAARDTVGVGDAENDHSFLDLCGCGVAVANAVDALKRHADLVTRAPRGAGVVELVAHLLANDLSDVRPTHARPASAP